MTNKKEFEDGDHSFKKWFSIMWKNGYIFLFLVGLGAMITQLVMWDEMMEMVRENYSWSTWGAIMVTIGMLMPAAIASVIAYKGFWQFWNDLKNGRSR